MAKKLTILVLAVAFVGFIDTAYLTVSFFIGRIPGCAVVTGCEEVLTSKYSKIAGFPLAGVGALYYAGIILLVSSWRTNGNKVFLSLATVLVSLGFVITLGLVYIQAAILNAFCLYCLFSAAVTISLFILIFTLLKLKRQ